MNASLWRQKWGDIVTTGSVFEQSCLFLAAWCLLDWHLLVVRSLKSPWRHSISWSSRNGLCQVHIGRCYSIHQVHIHCSLEKLISTPLVASTSSHFKAKKSWPTWKHHFQGWILWSRWQEKLAKFTSFHEAEVLKITTAQATPKKTTSQDHGSPPLSCASSFISKLATAPSWQLVLC